VYIYKNPDRIDSSNQETQEIKIMKARIDYGYAIITRAANTLGKGSEAIKKTDVEYRRMLNGQDFETANCFMFQQIAAQSAIQTILKKETGMVARNISTARKFYTFA
jgi:hypothetical protein